MTAQHPPTTKEVPNVNAYMVLSFAYSAAGRAVLRLVMIIATAAILSSLLMSAYPAPSPTTGGERIDTVTLYPRP